MKYETADIIASMFPRVYQTLHVVHVFMTIYQIHVKIQIQGVALSR